MPTMGKQDLAQSEVWDDSALVDSWNEAFEEYKKYHSLALKGEKVKLHVPESGEILSGDANNVSTTIISDQRDELQAVATNGDQSSEVQAEAGDQQPAGLPKVSTIPAMPQALMGTVQNEDLKNLMMSWYYAGYYTGLYEGKQQGYASALQR